MAELVDRPIARHWYRIECACTECPRTLFYEAPEPGDENIRWRWWCPECSEALRVLMGESQKAD